MQQLIRLVRTASMSRDAYERGASEERRRLAQDLHDDVGARLMTGLNVADDKTRPILHAALGDIRAIAGGMIGQTAPLDRVLADIRHECVRRFEAAGLETDWPAWPDDSPLVLLDYRLQKALASGLREVASNIIRHAAARHVTIEVKLDGDHLSARVGDDGKGLPEAVLTGEEGRTGPQGSATPPRRDRRQRPFR
ncbi:MAG: ATP-binding protein [Asticcacaulis sp.]